MIKASKQRILLTGLQVRAYLACRWAIMCEMMTSSMMQIGLLFLSFAKMDQEKGEKRRPAGFR